MKTDMHGEWNSVLVKSSCRPLTKHAILTNKQGGIHYQLKFLGETLTTSKTLECWRTVRGSAWIYC